MLRVVVHPDLTFLLAPARRHGPVLLPDDGTSTPGHVVESLGIPLPEVGELRVERGAQETRIEVLPVERPQPVSSSPPRFLLDVHLGGLARRLWLLGVDAAYRNDADDDELVDRARRERRVLLTQDRGLLRRRALPEGAYVRGAGTSAQLVDVLDRFAPPLAPWTRCGACGGPLEPVDRSEVEHLLEPGTRRTYQVFSRCRACGRPYWRGAHSTRLSAVVEEAQRVVDARRSSHPTGRFETATTGYAAGMSEDSGRQQGQGKTAGLPGQHADPRTRALPEDQRDDTVAMGDVAPGAEAEGVGEDRRQR